MKKILIFSHEFPPFIGGVGTVAKQLTEWFVANNYEVDVLTRKQENLEIVPGVNFHQVDVMDKFWFLSYRRYVNQKLILDSYDLIILNEAAPTISAGFSFSKKQLSKCLVYVHGLEIENIYTDSILNIPRQLFGFKYFHRRSVNLCKKVISVGSHMKEKFIVKSLIDGVESKVDVILAGIDSSVFKKINSDNVNKKSKLNLVSASRIVREKGYFEKLDIFGKLVNDGLDLSWTVCGDGDDYRELVETIKNKGLESHVIMKGACNRNELNEIYNNSDLFWLLSNYDEALPLVYVEAQMSGIPAIGWNKGGTRDTIDSSVSGYLVNNEDECMRIIKAIYNEEIKFDDKKIHNHAGKFDMNITLRKLKEYI